MNEVKLSRRGFLGLVAAAVMTGGAAHLLAQEKKTLVTISGQSTLRGLGPAKWVPTPMQQEMLRAREEFRLRVARHMYRGPINIVGRVEFDRMVYGVSVVRVSPKLCSSPLSLRSSSRCSVFSAPASRNADPVRCFFSPQRADRSPGFSSDRAWARSRGAGSSRFAIART